MSTSSLGVAKPAIAYERAYEICVQKIARTIKCLADEPKSGAFSKTGDYFSFNEGFYDIGNWTSSFFTGEALLAFETTGDIEFLKQTNRLGDWYRNKVTVHAMDTMHDMGFLYILYSIANYKITGDLGHRAVALKAADEFSKRYVPRGEYIQAWGRMDDERDDYAALAIIDCMMNLPLLFWASEETGNRFYREIAIKHADTTMKCFVRPDSSVYHAYRFDIKTGKPAGGANYCGHNVETHWARGTTWAIYGFALAYRYTKDARYLETSKRVARKYLELTCDNPVPVWDFRLGKEMPSLVDTSATAIAACGFRELARISPAETQWSEASDTALAALCNETYLDADLKCHGVLKMSQVGDGVMEQPGKYKAQNVYTSWGDYFFMEALAKKLKNVQGYW